MSIMLSSLFTSPPAGDTNSVMTVLPTFNLPTQVECFRLVHMVDNSGFPFPVETVELRPLVLSLIHI